MDDLRTGSTNSTDRDLDSWQGSNDRDVPKKAWHAALADAELNPHGGAPAGAKPSPASGTAPATRQPPQPSVSPERAKQIDHWVHDNADVGFPSSLWSSGHDNVDGALRGQSSLGALNPAEQRYVVDKSLQVWQRNGDDGSIRSLADQVQTPGARQAVLQTYAEHAAAAAQKFVGHEGDNSARAVAYSLAGGAAKAAPNDAALRHQIEALGPDRAGAFADAQTWGAMPNDKGGDDTGLSRTLTALNGGPESAAARSFTTHVLASGIDWNYRRTDFNAFSGTPMDMGAAPMDKPFATQLARLLHPGDAAAQRGVEGRLSGILASPQASHLFAADFGDGLFGQSAAAKQASVGARFQALAAIDHNPAITAQSLASSSSPWTNRPLVETMAQEPAQATLAAHGDQAFALRGTNLDNFVGTAMNLAPNVPKGETPQQAALREQDTANGQHSYFSSGQSEEPVRLVRDAIRKAAEATGGSRDAPQVASLPVMLSNADTGPVQVPLFRVDGPKGSQYVDNQGQRYTSFADWKARNTLPDGVVAFPADGHLRADASGKVQLQSEDTPETHNTLHHIEHALDKVALVGGLVAGGAIVIGSGGTLAPVVLGAVGIYGAARGAQDLSETASRNGNVNPLESSQARADWLNVMAGTLTAGGSMAGRLAQIAGGSNVLSRGAATAAVATRYAAAGADTLAAANQAHDLATNWDRMSPGDRITTGLTLAFWGMGARAQLHEGNFFDFNAQRETLLQNSRPPVVQDPKLPSDYVGLRQGDGKLGDLGDVQIVTGSHPNPADVQAHVVLAQDKASLSGLEGRMRRFFGDNGAANVPGTSAFRTNAEVEKMGRYIGQTETQLANPKLSHAERVKLQSDLEGYRAQLAQSSDELALYEAHPGSGMAPDDGDVARISTAARNEAARLGYPATPQAGYEWQMVDGNLRARPASVAHQDGAFRGVYEWRSDPADPARGSLVRAANDPYRPVAQGAPEQVGLTPQARAEIQPLLQQRTQIRAEITRLLNGRSATTLTGSDKARYDQLVGGRLNHNSRDVGEIGALDYARQRVQQEGGSDLRRLYGGPQAESLSGDFDDVFSYRGADGRTRYLVLEAKGGSSELGTRNVNEPRRAYQGTQQYYETIRNLMLNTDTTPTGNPARDAARASAVSTARELARARSGDVEYTVVKTPITERAGPSVASAWAQPFNIRRPAP